MTGVLPLGAVPLSATRAAVLVAVTHQKHPTVRTVAEYAGVNVQTAYRHLECLRQLGVIEWTPNTAGTLHSLVSIHPVRRGSA